MRFAPAFLALMALSGPAMAEGPQPYRARYDVFDEQGAKVGATDFSMYGNACSGYATESVTDLIGNVHDEHMTFEPADGRSLEFSILTGQGGRELSNVHGSARLAGGGVDVTVDDSGRHKVTDHFDGDATFPAAYDRLVLAAAVAGRPGFVTAHVVDGRSATDVRPVTVSSTVGPAPVPAGVPDALTGLRAFKVTTRFFPAGSGSGEAEHVISEVEYENGVSAMIEDTSGGHVLTMQLASLELVPQAACKDGRR